MSHVLEQPPTTQKRFKIKRKETFKIKRKSDATKRFTIKRKSLSQSLNQFQLFVAFCQNNALPFFQFYDSNQWTGPAIKVHQDDFEHIQDLLQEFNNLLLGDGTFSREELFEQFPIWQAIFLPKLVVC